MIDGAQNNNILIVEDIDNMRVTIASMLVKLGFNNVYQAKNGVEALTILEKRTVDIVISDLAMPKMGGIELLEHIRRNPELDKLPFVIVSSVVDHEVVRSAVKMGVSQYIVKPFSLNILEDRLKKALHNPVNFSAREASKEQAQTSSGEKNESPINILVVDDVPDNIHLISSMLKDKYRVRAATSGVKALKMCMSATPPDLVLLDIMMPEMDGLEVIRRIKSTPDTHQITVIFLTALSSNDDIVKGLELGAVDYITKPIVPEILKARVAAHVATIRTQQAAADQVESILQGIRIRDDFERIMQHDLKNQLQVMRSSAEVIQKNLTNAAQVAYMANAIESGSIIMSQMIDNMITIHQLESGNYPYNPEPLQLNDILSQTIAANSVTVRERKLEVSREMHEDITILGEANLSQSIVNNLYQNAIQAAPKGSAVKIGAFKKDNTVVFTIHNNGVIPVEIREKFFDKYVTSRKTGGSGIGTYAVKLMVEIQKGQVDFESSPNEGTTLRVKFQHP